MMENIIETRITADDTRQRFADEEAARAEALQRKAEDRENRKQETLKEINTTLLAMSQEDEFDSIVKQIRRDWGGIAVPVTGSLGMYNSLGITHEDIMALPGFIALKNYAEGLGYGFYLRKSNYRNTHGDILDSNFEVVILLPEDKE